MSHEKFLRFNDTNIVFVNVEGVYYIALRPICAALNIEYTRSFKNAKNDEILGPALAIQPMQVSNNGKSQIRNMTCIPERYIYGWLFSLRSDSKELLSYKKTCYDLMYNYFHGSVTDTNELLLSLDDNAEKIRKIQEELKNDDRAKELAQLQSEKKNLHKRLSIVNNSTVQQLKFFDN